MFLPGDIICEHGGGLLARAIRWAERAPGETPVYANHTAICTSQTDVTEALWTVTTRPASVALAGVAHQVWRNTELTNAQRGAVAGQALCYAGRGYGAGKLLLHLGDALLTKATGREVYAFRRMAGLDRYPICSWLVAEAYGKALGIQFGLPAAEASPDDIWRYMAARPARWALIETVNA